jgi:hypothetical protein
MNIVQEFWQEMELKLSNNMKRIKKALASIGGVMDLQSVMVGVVITGIVSGTAVVSLIGFARMMSDDNSRTTVKTLSMGLDTFYTEKDRYPATLAELADGKYVPVAYKTLPTTELCYVPATGAYPQAYTATVKSATTGTIFALDADTQDPAKIDVYPDTLTCK